ncbi:MAG: SDR family oxidoreductase [Candidatus Cloacimonetes bacterium]|nr:SDR family oxidoreductase [Candidatus Cloacimonadota bacterium]
MKSVLVVGGAGYLGGAVTDLLLKSKYNVRVYDNLLYEESFRKPVDFIYGDVRDKKKLLNQLRWADVVVWLAAIVGDGACQLNPDLTMAINRDSVKWLSENYDGRIIFMSTCSVYGAQNRELDENSPTNPLSIYASSKLQAENFLINKNAIIFRLGTLFGVGDLFSRVRMDLVVNILTVKAATLGKINVFGGNQFRPLLHVKDVARMIKMNIETEYTGIYNLKYRNVRIIDLAYQVQNHYPNCIIEKTDMPFQDTRNYRVSSQKAKETFGFSTNYSIDTGIEEIKYLINTGRIENVNNTRYSNYKHLEEQINRGKNK